MTNLKRWGRRLVVLLALGALALAGAHGAIRWAGRMTPPPVELGSGEVQRVDARLQRLGPSYLRRRGALLEIGLSGDPVAVGAAHARLARAEREHIEGVMLERFRQQVSSPLAGLVLLDLAQLRYRKLDAHLGNAQRFELAAEALAAQPDPYADVFPTYQRLVYLNALYDIGLSFEHSPLLGCTSFTFDATAASDGPLLARAFDFEIDEIFDRSKAVFLVREAGHIPFASVAWPGLVGVVSGMNLAGVAAVAHGARAGRPQAQGEPMLNGLRRVLATTRTTDEAIAALSERDVMVSHIVIVMDATGRGAAVERVPRTAQHVRWLGPRAVVTNHFEGPAASDPKNQRVRAETSTRPRRERGEELLRGLAGPVSPADAVRLLRDRRGPGDTELPLGDRRAIDALIATHGVVMNTKSRVVWVSESPHLLGRFVAFDLERLLAPDYDPASDHASLRALPADPLLTSGRYEQWRASTVHAP